MCCRPDTRRFSGRRWKAGSRAGWGLRVHCRLQFSITVMCLFSGGENTSVTADTKGTSVKSADKLRTLDVSKYHKQEMYFSRETEELLCWFSQKNGGGNL